MRYFYVQIPKLIICSADADIDSTVRMYVRREPVGEETVEQSKIIIERDCIAALRKNFSGATGQVTVLELSKERYDAAKELVANRMKKN